MTDRNKAETLMAGIIYADLNLEVNPVVIGVMIRKRWDRLAPLAHAIHDAPDMTKNGIPIMQAEPVKPLGAKKRAANELRAIIAAMTMNSLDGQADRLRKVLEILDPA